MRHIFKAAVLAASLPLADSAMADLVYIDFGSTSATGNVGGVQYNDVWIDGNADGIGGQASLQVNGAGGTTSPAPLLSTTNSATGIGIQVVSLNDAGNLADNGSEYAGPYPAVLSGIEASALRSHWFFNRGKQMRVTLSGLDNSATYNFVIYGASKQVGTASNSFMTGVGVTGSGADFTNKTINTFDNQTETIQWSDITPDGGDIVFDLQGSRETWLNFMSIEVVPEPSSLALLGLGGLLVARRRR